MKNLGGLRSLHLLIHPTFLTLLSLTILCLLYLHHYPVPFFPLDDPYIVLHNAQVLHAGFDPNYPGSPALSGATSPIHLAIIFLLLYFMPPAWTLIISAWLAIFVYALGLLRLAFLYRASAFIALCFVVTGLTIGLMPQQLLNGVETGWSLAAITWTLILFSEKDFPCSRIIRNTLCAWLPFFHPELIFLSVLLVIWKARQQPIRETLINIMIMMIAAAPWLIAYWINTGVPYPTTLLAKAAFTAERYLSWSVKWHVLIGSFALFIMMVGYFNLLGMFFFLCFTSLGRVGIIFIFLFLLLYFVHGPSALNYNVGRYNYVLLPILFYGVISCVSHTDKTARFASKTLIVFMACLALWQVPDRWDYYVNTSTRFTQQLKDVAGWCQQHLPANATILVHDAGYISYATSFHLVDLVGLKTPMSIAAHEKWTLPSKGRLRAKAVADIIQKTHPSYLILLPDWGVAFGLISGLEEQNVRLKLLYDADNGYEVYAVQ